MGTCCFCSSKVCLKFEYINFLIICSNIEIEFNFNQNQVCGLVFFVKQLILKITVSVNCQKNHSYCIRKVLLQLEVFGAETVGNACRTKLYKCLFIKNVLIIFTLWREPKSYVDDCYIVQISSTIQAMIHWQFVQV